MYCLLFFQLADALVEYETLNSDEVRRVIKGEPLKPVEERVAQVELGETQQTQPQPPSQALVP